jgi:hypothetical protein
LTEQPLARDWAFIRAAIESLQDYLLSSELYWPLYVHPREKITGNLLQLTLGNLILTQARLKGYPWASKEASELADANAKITQVKEKWKTAWTNKAVREIPARLKLWRDYVDDLCDQPRHKVANYHFQVRWRTALDFLNIEAAGRPDTDLAHLFEVDLRLKKISQPGNFVWEAELEAAFPKERFWYLYVTIQGC